MKSFCHRIAAVVTMGLLSSGCAMEPLDEELAAPPPLTTLGGGGNPMNGLPPDFYHPLRNALDNLMQVALPASGQLGSDPLFGPFLASEEGTKVFKYAIQCALPLGEGIDRFAGEGLMTTAGGWVNGGLDQRQRDDLHTCITTRLNPYGKEVPIWIGGYNTTHAVSSDDYEYSEAVWSVTVGPTSATFSVWPADTFALRTSCAQLPVAIEEEFYTRICHNSPGLCQLTLRTDFATACTGTPGAANFMCDGQRAVETRLNKLGWKDLHTKCAIIN